MTLRFRVSTAIVVAAMFIGVVALPLRAQPASPTSLPADTLFADASAKEAAVRKALVTDEPLPTLLKAVRTVVADYENVVRHYPTSGFCDDALWRAAKLSRDAFEEFHEARERTTALRLLQLLQTGYPSSRLVKLAPEEVAWLNAHPARTGASTTVASGAPVEAPPPTPPSTISTEPRPSAVSSEPKLPAAVAPSPASSSASSPPPSSSSAGSPVRTAAAASKLVNIKAVRRAILPDVVRVVIELDAEVPFHDERIEGPSRVFIDLPSTRANPSLIDQTIRFDADTDIVRQIRIGRHPDSVTRVVLEAAGVSSYSVYPLYSPFRLVIDCLRASAAVATAAPPSSGAPIAPSAARPAIVLPTPPAPTPPPAQIAKTAPTAPPPQASYAPLPPPVVASSAPADPRPSSAATTSDTIRLPEPEQVVSAEPSEHADKRSSRPATNEPRASASERPVWAATLARPAVLPVLQARRVRWVLSMPAGTITRLPDTRSAPAPAPPAVTAGLSKTLPSATATPPPSPNVTGGLSIARQLGLGVSRIVIDPGHGGHDPGAKGEDTTEAELVLDVALRLEKMLGKMPGVEVVLTRRDNQFVALQERTAIANREGADLFLSIHANASAVPSARGVETYFLNFASNQNAAAVAARENATSEQNMGVLQDVVKAIALNSKRDESRDFATYVQREMLESLRGANKTIKDLGVKQAPFVVLIGASMPSVLAEISFLTNPQEAKLLRSSGYRQRIAQALFEGIKDYQTSLKSAAATTQQQN